MSDQVETISHASARGRVERDECLRILVVEDDDDLRASLVLALTPDASKVAEASNGAIAESMIFEGQADNYDLIVSDIRMPVRTGLELVATLRARGSHVPVILISGFAEARQVLDAGAPDRTLLVAKPFELDDLRTAVRNLDRLMPTQPPASAPTRRTVLLAEDNEALRELVAMALEEAGFDVRAAGDGEAMIELLQSAVLADPPPVALVMDIRMPRFSGLDVLRAARLSRWHLPVVLMTAFPDEETVRLAESLGAACTLEKPLDVDDLIQAIELATRLEDEGLSA